MLACLEKDPTKRPQTADELAAMLSGARVREEWTQGKAREWWDANRTKRAGAPAPEKAVEALEKVERG